MMSFLLPFVEFVNVSLLTYSLIRSRCRLSSSSPVGRYEMNFGDKNSSAFAWEPMPDAYESIAESTSTVLTSRCDDLIECRFGEGES